MMHPCTDAMRGDANAARQPRPLSSRRQFLTRAAAAGLGLLSARGTVAAPTRPLRLGSGEHTYECFHDYLMPPQGEATFGDTQGIAQDAAGNLYISHTVGKNSPKNDAIAVFDANGKFLTAWGERFKGGGHGLDIRRENGTEYLYHCDTAHRQIVKTTTSGKVVWEIGVPLEPGVYGKDGKEKPFIPTNVAFAPGGDFYVGDGYGSSFIHRYNRHGDWQQTFGGLGGEPGTFKTPHGLWIDDRSGEPLLAVADRGNGRIQYLSLDGKPVSIVTNGMRKPCHFSLHHDLMLVPDLSSVVTILDKQNKVVAQLGDGASLDGAASKLRGHPRTEFIPGKFIHPHDAEFLPNGDILVAEWVPVGRVTLLRKVRG